MRTQAPSPSPSPAPSSSSPKEQLLAAAVAHVAAHGIADTSLRELASAIGTSHRMLIHHFGSKEALLVEIVRTMEQRQRDTLAELRRSPSPDLPPGEILWRRLNDPALEPFERLFFEVYGQALQGRAWAAGLLDGVVDDWLAPIAELLAEAGVSTAATSFPLRSSITTCAFGG